MARPHIEFVQCQHVAWEPLADGSAVKRLNADPASGEETLIVRYPAGFARAHADTGERAEELFVLDGALRLDDAEHRRHGYAFLPRGSGLGARRSADGAVLLVFRHGRDDPHSRAGVAAAIALDTVRMPWDATPHDPKLGHLRLARKVLRLGPGDSGRTFLLTGLPHGLPDVPALPTERHDHAEEMLMLHGEMWAPEGRMGPGAYFYRPPGIEHGPHVSETGFLQIMRSPGANRIVTHWSDRHRALPVGAAHAPVIPPDAPAAWRLPWAGAALY